MRHTIALAAALSAVAALASLPAIAAGKLADFKSVSVDLPFGSTTLPPGPNQDTVAANCLACHSTGMILNQPAMTLAGWKAEVDKMRAVYKAPVAEKDVAAIAAYLAHIKGAK